MGLALGLVIKALVFLYLGIIVVSFFTGLRRLGGKKAPASRWVLSPRNVRNFGLLIAALIAVKMAAHAFGIQ